MKTLYFFLFGLLAINSVSAQKSDCKVLLDSIQGTYTGDCKNGKASGTGKSEGVHTYDGEFKNGLPEGMGKYTWANGDYFYGTWKRGKKEGKGQMHQFENGVESMIDGYWKNDIFRGEYKDAYVIQNQTTDINRVEISKVSNTDRTVSVSVSGLKSDQGFNSRVVMTGYAITRGTYVSKSNNVMTNSEITIFRGVVFPFRAMFNFGQSILEIEIFEEGGWDVIVPVNK
ncbi:MAG: hypothetical protein IPL84_07215 [Chitinophagaceae bacterium]|nr:hypothetical protein [Chitinophagaceae bacterium]